MLVNHLVKEQPNINFTLIIEKLFILISLIKKVQTFVYRKVDNANKIKVKELINEKLYHHESTKMIRSFSI
jgi:hypothetical protein